MAGLTLSKRFIQQRQQPKISEYEVMTKKDLQDLFKIEDILDLPKVISELHESDGIEKDFVYKKLLEINNYDMSFDWFQCIYEEEFAQRKQNKQDFTPKCVSVLLSKLTGARKGKIYEPTAGNGGLIIANWNFRKDELGEEFKAEEHPVECWELSDRSIPLLLLNLSIRGIVGTVNHGDVLTKEIKAKYVLSSDNQFSKIENVK